MASIAGYVGGDMSHRLCGDRDAASYVAAGTLGWSTAEYAIDMAGLTSQK